MAKRKTTTKKKVAKKPVKKKATKTKKKPVVKKKTTAVKKRKVTAVRKRKVVKKVDDYGRAPRGIATYEPIVDFDPKNPPSDYVIVKMNHELLDDMLQKMTRKRAQGVGVPCRRVR